MKQGWEVKKLGEVCTILMGQSPSSDTYNDLGEGLPFFQGNADFGRIHPSVRVYCNAPIRIADVDDILISVRAPIGAINITNTKCCIGRGLAAIKNGNRIKKSFAYHALIANKDKLIALGTGSTFKSIGRIALNDLLIPIPPLDEQENIVAELDCLSGIIEKKKQQLKEYDALAQSIFYEMFGNPIDNEKGWEVKRLGEITSDIFAGGDKPKDISPIQTEMYAYPVYANGDGDRGLLGYSKKYRVESKAVTIGARGASVGNCRICNEKFTPVVRLITIIPNSNMNILFLYHCLLHTEWDINGAGQAQLTTPNVISKKMFLPPLALQQEFASKIEAIEKQKELIKQSIAETETLFNSRMDFYFN